MLHEPKLSDDQVSQFRDQGFLALNDAFKDAEIDAIRAWAGEIAARPEEIGTQWVYHETSLLDGHKDLINRIENMTPFHEGLSKLANCLIPSVGQLLGEEAALFKDKINFKMSGGEGFEPHQDSQAGWEDYAKYFISVMVCIDEATLENGCLELAPRPDTMADAHLVGQEWVPLSEEATAQMDFKPYPVKPGDVIFFDSYAPHKSARNMTDTTRRLYFSTYNRLSEGDHLAAYYDDKRKSFPPDIEREADKEYVYRV
ncbi:MAG: phytanoyl-CoA dioxygenase family protein [Rhodospirillaceae bacterium]|jgi:2-aminoethylphosphonate dioxygenase|nr:phytanoyl-CoA dioxygenase family protein [Rhodospirillaceae bacterium]MBT4937694.1 phytanoyl-CoA dioxygenase family protein [Rhodospirillaceae bacterium]MBT5941407.1 phytanoyl-CoA dioxygenase family protein [Rhodospirillaceae bacterium]MBT7267937.1 phytanoyl-CoA dioxygenase family protein [Rhodospirillaceae bacterium]